MPNHALEPTAASGIRALAVPSSLRASAAAQRERYASRGGIVIALSTYLLLDGTCREAMEFYRSCLGGELSLSLVGDTPMKSMFPPEMHARVINAHLKAEGISLSASDWMLQGAHPVSGNTVCLFISGGTVRETRTLFDKLSAGASVTDPLAEQPFGLYGALNDRFGIRWMFHSASSA